MPFLDLPYTVTICGLAELRQFSASGITHVISILDPSWPEPQDFSRYPPHQRTLFRFHDTILDDPAMLPPGEDDIANLLALGKMAAWSRIDHLLIHCHMGVSRSTAAAAILLAENAPGQEDAVFDHLFEIRPRSGPTAAWSASPMCCCTGTARWLTPCAAIMRGWRIGSRISRRNCGWESGPKRCPEVCCA